MQCTSVLAKAGLKEHHNYIDWPMHVHLLFDTKFFVTTLQQNANGIELLILW
jgi:hypothetical protein